MMKIAAVLGNLGAYFRALFARWRRRKKDKAQDPFIYPHF